MGDKKKSTDDEQEDEYIQFMSRGDRFFLNDPYVYLINPDLVPQRVSIIKDLKIKEILPEFYQKLLEEGQIDFRILGQAIYSAARVHKNKVSLAIAYEKRHEEKLKIRKKRRAFQFKIPLPFYQTREMLTLAESANPDSFYAELLLGLQEEEERKKIEKIKAERRSKRGTTEAKRRRRRLAAADFESFDYELDLDRVAIEDIVNQTFEVIVRLVAESKDHEAEFSKVVKEMENETDSEEKRRITKARILISLLYLFRDEKITAEQELEEPYEIFIRVKSDNDEENDDEENEGS